MPEATLSASRLLADVAASGPSEAANPSDDARLKLLVEEHHAFVWRSLRRLGVAMSDVDDVAQKVFLVAARNLGNVARPQERSFLFATAIRAASNERRAQQRRRYEPTDDVDSYAHDAASPEQQAADRALLDRVLEPLSLELRSVFILFELERMTTPEIAELLDLPIGTAASRLRRARELVNGTIARLRARGQGVGR